MGEPLKIYANQAAVLAPLETRAAGPYSFPVELRGNALISTVFVEDIAGATITATWKDHNPLTSTLFTVDAHAPITANGYHRKFIAQATHGVSVLEITVAGGSPKFGVFITANQLVGNFPSPDSVQTVDGTVNAIIAQDGIPLGLQSGQDLTTPAGEVVLISTVVAPTKVLRLLRLEGQCRAWGYFTVWVDAVRVARANSGPSSENPFFVFEPYDVATAGQAVEVRYTQSYGPQLDVSATLFTLLDDA